VAALRGGERGVAGALPAGAGAAAPRWRAACNPRPSFSHAAAARPRGPSRAPQEASCAPSATPEWLAANAATLEALEEAVQRLALGKAAAPAATATTTTATATATAAPAAPAAPEAPHLSSRLAALEAQVQTLALEQQYLARHVEALTETQVTHELHLRGVQDDTEAAIERAIAPLRAALAAAEARAAAAESRAQAALVAAHAHATAVEAFGGRLASAEASAAAAEASCRRVREQASASRADGAAAVKALAGDVALFSAAADAAAARADAAATREASLRELVSRNLRACASADAQVRAHVGTITAEVSVVMRNFVERRFVENNALVDAALRERLPEYARSASSARIALVRTHHSGGGAGAGAGSGAGGAADAAAAAGGGAGGPPVVLVRTEGAGMERALGAVLSAYARDGGTQPVAVAAAPGTGAAAGGGGRPAAGGAGGA
jgi:hypothetical protein